MAGYAIRDTGDRKSLRRRKQRPERLNGGFGSASSRISIALLTKLAGIDTLLVPYKCIPLAVNNLVGGSIDFTFVDTNKALTQVKGGKLRALAVKSPKRSSVMPDWPAMAESMPGFDVTAWFARLGPAKLPADVVEKMNATLTQILG